MCTNQIGRVSVANQQFQDVCSQAVCLSVLQDGPDYVPALYQEKTLGISILEYPLNSVEGYLLDGQGI